MCFDKQLFKGAATGTASCRLPIEEVFDRYCYEDRI